MTDKRQNNQALWTSLGYKEDLKLSEILPSICNLLGVQNWDVLTSYHKNKNTKTHIWLYKVQPIENLKITRNLKNHWWVSHRKLHWCWREGWGKTWDDNVTPTPSKSSAHSKRRLSTHQRHLHIAFPSQNGALLCHSGPFSMMPLRKPSWSEGVLIKTRQVFPHRVQWSFLWDTHHWWPKIFKGFQECVISSVYCSMMQPSWLGFEPSNPLKTLLTLW
jgi:hypothetical protein